MPKIIIAQTEEDIARSVPVMVQLRPHLRQEEFVQRVMRQQNAFDYTLAALESGVQRFEAYRFYLINRMNIDCHHFTLKL